MEKVFFFNTLSSFIAAILSGGLLFWISKPRKKELASPTAYSIADIRQITLQMVEIRTVIIKGDCNKNQSKSEDDGTGIIIAFAAFLVGLTYLFLKYMDEILLVSQFFLTFFFTYTILSLINYCKRGVIGGIGWNVFLVFTVLSCFVGFYAIYLVKNPIVEAYSVSNWQELKQADSLQVFIKAGGWKSTWFTYQMIGLVCFYLGTFVLIPTLTYFNVAILKITNPESKFYGWLVKKTYTFSRPTRSVVLSLIFNAMAFLLISGLVHQWLTN